MKDKEKLSMYVDITRITIILCWIALIAFWCLKLFGGNWFEIMVENENFIKFSALVQNTWLKYVISLFTIFFSNYFLLCAIDEKFTFKGKELIIVIAIIFSMWLVVNFIKAISFWYGYVIMILFSIIRKKSWKKLYGVLAFVLSLIFSILSMITRSVELKLMTDYFITSILIIDMNIMIILYYLYVNLIRLKKEV